MLVKENLIKQSNKANNIVNTLDEKVQHYLEKSKVEDFSIDPEIQQIQIRKAWKLLKKIARYLTSETINEDFDNYKQSYEEILKNTKNVLSIYIEEGLYFINKLKYILCKFSVNYIKHTYRT